MMLLTAKISIWLPLFYFIAVCSSFIVSYRFIVPCGCGFCTYFFEFLKYVIKTQAPSTRGTGSGACYALMGQKLPYTRVFQMSLSVLIVYFAASLALDNFMCLVCKPFWLSTSVLTGHAYKSFEWNRLLSFYIFHYLSVVSLSLLLFLSLTHTPTQLLVYFLTESLSFKNTQKNYTKKILMSQITTIVWSLT